MTQIIPITPDLVSEYKTVRLCALRDSPTSFGSTLQRESQFTEQEWSARTARLINNRDVGFFAVHDGNYAGLALCFTSQVDSQRGELISTWVDPAYRKLGIGRLLIETIAAWAAEHGIRLLTLMVTSVNHSAIDFYRRLGFTPTGRTEPYPNDPEIVEYEMSRKIR